MKTPGNQIIAISSSIRDSFFNGLTRYLELFYYMNSKRLIFFHKILHNINFVPFISSVWYCISKEHCVLFLKWRKCANYNFHNHIHAKWRVKYKSVVSYWFGYKIFYSYNSSPYQTFYFLANDSNGKAANTSWVFILFFLLYVFATAFI